MIAIIGKSGSGKSTLLRCINGLEVFQDGALTVDGKPLLHDKRDGHARAAPARRHDLPELQPVPAPDASARNVMLAPTLVKKRGRGRGAARRRASCSQRVGLAEKFDAMPDQLSGGQQQRVAIARALAMEPAVLLCDEITSALDPELVGEVLRVVESLADEGMTLLMVTHEMSFARKVGDRVIFMHQGRVHEMGPPAELFGNPQTPELQAVPVVAARLSRATRTRG